MSRLARVAYCPPAELLQHPSWTFGPRRLTARTVSRLFYQTASNAKRFFTAPLSNPVARRSITVALFHRRKLGAQESSASWL